MKLAGRGRLLSAVRHAVDDERTGSANSFPAVVFESDRILAFRFKSLVDDVEHFKERHLRRDFGRAERFELAVDAGTLLPPDVEREIHLLTCSSSWSA